MTALTRLEVPWGSEELSDLDSLHSCDVRDDLRPQVSSCEARASASALTWIPDDPFPTIATFFPRRSKFSFHLELCHCAPANESMPSSFGMIGELSAPAALMRTSATTVRTTPFGWSKVMVWDWVALSHVEPVKFEENTNRSRKLYLSMMAFQSAERVSFLP